MKSPTGRLPPHRQQRDSCVMASTQQYQRARFPRIPRPTGCREHACASTKEGLDLELGVVARLSREGGLWPASESRTVMLRG